MGTKIQSKTYNPGYYSVRNLNNNAGNGMWALYDDDKTLKNGNFYDSFLTSSAMDTYIGHEKEKMRQTILKHESEFRNQLQELHRLYRRQRDLMNELHRREFVKHSLPAETSKSSLFLSQTPCEDADNTRKDSDFPLVGSSFGRSPASDAGIIQPHLSFIKGKSTCSPFSSHDRVHSKEKSLKPRCNNFQRKRFNLELPAEFYTNNEGKQQGERFCGVVGTESYLLERNRDVNLSPGSGLDSDCNGDSLISKLYLKSTYNLADLNKPIWVEETPITDSVNNVDGSTCLGEDIQKQDIFVNSISGSQFWSKEMPQRGLEGKDGRIVLNNRHSESDRSGNGQFCNSIAGQTRYDDHASLGGISGNHTSTLFRSLQVEPRKAHETEKISLSDHSNLAPQRERTIFGGQISGRNHNRSADPSHAHSLHPLNQQSVGMKSKPSCIATCRNMSSTLLGQKVVSFQGNPCLCTIAPITGRPPNSQMQLPGFSGDEMHSCNNLRSPSSISEVSNQDALCHSFQSGVKQLHGCLDLNSYPHPQQHSASPDLEMPHFCGKQIKVKEIIYQMNLDSLQNHSQHFFNKAGMTNGPFIDLASSACVFESGSKKFDDGDSQMSKKILGFSIVNVPHISKDLTSPRSASRTTHRASNLDTDGTSIYSSHNSESDSQLKVIDSDAENGLNNCFSGLRHQIDLNLSVNEEEAPSAPCLRKTVMKIATTEIDLEASGVLESNSVVSAEADHLEKLNEMGSKESLDDSRERNEELVRVAAEAIIDISSSQLDVVDPSCQLQEALSTDCLLWLADIISSCEVSAHESKVTKGLMKGDDACGDKTIPEGMDYFEFMTLKLEDSKEQEYFYKPYNLENLNDEENIDPSVPKRPRKGITRRGRQRKDFQRDVLPGLVSLSRYEVLEDLQTIENTFKACGYTWQSSLSQRGAAKNGKGRKRAVGLAPSQTASAVCPPPVQQPTYRELELEDRNLTGWGKRTRRLPRHRCSNGTHTPVLECRFAV